MATFGTGLGRPLPGRGPSPGFRFTLYAIVSVVCMFLDQRDGWLQSARFALQGAAYPLQLAVNSPSAAWAWTKQIFESREKLQRENAELRNQKRELELRSIRYAALARENAQLRGLAEALPAVTERWLAAEVVSVELDSLRQRLLINRGTRNGVFKGQTVLTDDGLLGQTTRVGPWSAEIILVTDPEHAVPVQIERTGLRTIAVGAGKGSALEASELELPYLPASADIQQGDLLLTSGLGGVFPAGFPVARVTDVRRDAVQSFAQVRAEPLARLDEDREVVLVWFRAGHPAAPATLVAGEVSSGNPAIQPQPKPVPPAAAQSQPQAAPPLAAERRPEPRSAPPRARERQPQPEPETPAPQAAGEPEPNEAGSAEEQTPPATQEEFVPMPDSGEAPPEQAPVPEPGEERE